MHVFIIIIPHFITLLIDGYDRDHQKIKQMLRRHFLSIVCNMNACTGRLNIAVWGNMCLRNYEDMHLDGTKMLRLPQRPCYNFSQKRNYKINA